MGIEITQPIDGEILNRHLGEITGNGLKIEVKGRCPGASRVAVNGAPADAKNGEFSVPITIRDIESAITAKTDGGEADSVRVLYDKNSIKRYRFSLDDNCFFFRDIAARRHKSIFENAYMALWKRLHDAYGTKVVCNIYCQRDDFNLTMMPDRYKGEWRDNAHWFRLTFHALQNDPANPYINATYDEIARDYDLVVNEILRFAGEEVMDTFTTVHWGEATVEACRALRDRGIKGLCGYFIFKDGKPCVSYYLDAAHTEYMSTHDYWKDMEEDLIFIRHAIVCNNVKLEDTVPHLEKVASNPHQGEVLELMTHERHFYPGWPGHRPDYAERCEAAVRWCTENGYAPVFYSDGFIGSPTE